MLGFDDFWAVYPNRKAKKDALKAWTKLNPSQELIQTIIECVEVYAKTKQWRQGYIPLPATFIRGERWDDELTQADFYQARL